MGAMLREIRGGLANHVLQPTARYARTRLMGAMRGQHMRQAKGESQLRRRDDSGPLRIVSGGYLRSYQQKSPQSVERTELSEDGLKMEWGTSHPAGRPNEKGARIRVTDKMRRFFWAMWYETGEGGWRGMALSKKTHFEIPARPHLGPALRSESHRITRYAVDRFRTLVQDAAAKHLP